MPRKKAKVFLPFRGECFKHLRLRKKKKPGRRKKDLTEKKKADAPNRMAHDIVNGSLKRARNWGL